MGHGDQKETERIEKYIWGLDDIEEQVWKEWDTKKLEGEEVMRVKFSLFQPIPEN